MTTQPGSLPALRAILGFVGPSWGYPHLPSAVLHHSVCIVGYSGPFCAISGVLGTQTLTTQPGGILALGAIFGFCRPSLGYRGLFRAILCNFGAIVGYSGQFCTISEALGIQTLTTQPGGISAFWGILGLSWATQGRFVPSRGYYGLLRSVLCHLWCPGYSNFDNPAWWSFSSWDYLLSHFWPAWAYLLLFRVILDNLGGPGYSNFDNPAWWSLSSWGYFGALGAILGLSAIQGLFAI